MTLETHKGFTLIELALVLVIIGLVVGGILVGQELVKAAEVRATIAQIEKYNTAVNTFRTKYNALPGDLNAITAQAFGFTPRGTLAGQGDGNGIIEGYDGTRNRGPVQSGETLTFWTDLSVGNTANGLNLNVNLIDASFSAYASPAMPAPAINAANVDTYIPAAKLGHNNYIYIFSYNTVNFFAISPVVTTAVTGVVSPPVGGLTVNQAYQIDKKIDDSYPLAGNVSAAYSGGYAPYATADTATTCFSAASLQLPGAYSLSINNGSGLNCYLSMHFQ